MIVNHEFWGCCRQFKQSRLWKMLKSIFYILCIYFYTLNNKLEMTNIGKLQPYLWSLTKHCLPVTPAHMLKLKFCFLSCYWLTPQNYYTTPWQVQNSPFSFLSQLVSFFIYLSFSDISSIMPAHPVGCSMSTKIVTTVKLPDNADSYKSKAFSCCQSVLTYSRWTRPVSPPSSCCQDTAACQRQKHHRQKKVLLAKRNCLTNRVFYRNNSETTLKGVSGLTARPNCSLRMKERTRHVICRTE